MVKKTFSPTEEKLLRIFPRDGQRVTTEKLTKIYYRGKEIPRYGQIYIANTMRGLVSRVNPRRDGFKIKRTPKSGPRKIQFWAE